ncbi:MAG: hypothetical protein SFU85_02750 [Candidatus Methylacidiphilales bacterium]|nr:hypothetical protein [Candidatus Methylacidiphilales bacterium]
MSSGAHSIKDLMAIGVDGLSFGLINALQLRAKSGAHDAEQMNAYFSRWSGGGPADFFAIPDGTPLPDLRDGRGTVVFESPVASECPENNRVHVDLWPGPQGWDSPVMFMLHGFMSVSDVGYRLWAQKLNRLGWSAAFFHLPYHYGRRPKGAWSGEMALSANLIRTAEGLRQAVVELRIVCRALRARGVPHIGLWATSYGGWIAGLLAHLETSVSTAWLLEPIVDVEEAIFASPATLTLRRQLRQRGITRNQVAPHCHLVCPGRHQPVIPPENILLMAGTFDRIAPPETIHRVHRLWKGSHYAECRQGHVGYQLMPESLRLAQEKMPHLFPGCG